MLEVSGIGKRRVTRKNSSQELAALMGLIGAWM